MDIRDTSTKVLIVAVVVLTGLALTAAVLWGGAREPVAQKPVEGIDISKVQYDGDAYAGKVDAPVTVAFWSDYQCPICKNFELGTLPQILKDYVDTGKVKIVFLDFAFLGEDSTAAALYGRSVWSLYPEKYLEWRTAMYTAQDQEHDIGFGDAASIDKLDATIAGLDAAKIAADVQANKEMYQAMITADRVEVTKAGITGTPSFIIGTQLIVGNQPYSVFKNALDPLVK